MEDSLIIRGWKIEEGELGGADDPLLPKDILAIWSRWDRADDFLEIVDLLLGDDQKTAVQKVIERAIETGIHISGRRLRQATIWITLIDDEDGCFDEVYVKKDVFVSPEVREMIEVAAMGKEILDQPIVFGLRAQGHLPTIEKMLAEGASWDEIGKAIHWEPATAKDFYERERNIHD